jgi:hypothetical protein
MPKEAKRPGATGTPPDRGDTVLLTPDASVIASAVPSTGVEAPRDEALQATLEAQAEGYTNFGFPRRLRMNSGVFKDHIMHLAENMRLDVNKKRFPFPVALVGTQIPAWEQFEMMGFDVSGLRGVDRDPQGYKTPQGFHLVYMNDGTKIKHQSVDDLTASLRADERPGNQYDAPGLLNDRPKLLTRSHFIVIPGTWSTKMHENPIVGLHEVFIGGEFMMASNGGRNKMIYGLFSFESHGADYPFTVAR